MPDVFVADDTAETPEDPVRPQTRTMQKVPGVLNGKKPTHMRATASYSEFPENIKFENQEDGEIIYLFLRKHVVTNASWIFFSIVLTLIPPLFIAFVLPVMELAGVIIPPNFLLILVLFFYLIVLGYAFVSYVSWFFNIGIVTNLRVVDIDVNDITSKSVAATEMSDILDVEYNQKGFLQNFFDYGNVHMQLAGQNPNFEFLLIPRPARTADAISDLMREVKGE